MCINFEIMIIRNNRYAVISLCFCHWRYYITALTECGCVLCVQFSCQLPVGPCHNISELATPGPWRSKGESSYITIHLFGLYYLRSMMYSSVLSPLFCRPLRYLCTAQVFKFSISYGKCACRIDRVNHLIFYTIRLQYIFSR